jgi:hypothetical protein
MNDHNSTGSDLTSDLLAAILAATPERKEAALKVLRGETTPVAKPVTGPLLMNINAAAKFLGVSRTTLWKIVLAGAVEKVEVYSGSFWVTRESLEALAARSAASSGQAPSTGSGQAGSTSSPQAISGPVWEVQFPLGKRGRPRKEGARREDRSQKSGVSSRNSECSERTDTDRGTDRQGREAEAEDSSQESEFRSQKAEG